MKYLVAAVSVILLLVLSGCAAVPMASIDQDTKAKEFVPAQNKAALYIYRNENFGGAIPMSVSVNGKSLGQTAAKTYFRLNLLPGKYNVESHAENVANLSLTAEANKNYFVWQEVKMGMWMARCQLQQADETAGRAGVMESKLIATAVAENDMTPLDQVPANDAVAQKLRDLQNLRKDNVITEEEFQKKRQELLEKL
jgi:hypothetical protein